MSLAIDDPRHGTKNGYTNYRCRCDSCREAVRTYRRTGPAAEAVRVTSRAQVIAVSLVRNECPDLWRDILDQAWLEVAGHPARSVGRPRGAA